MNTDRLLDIRGALDRLPDKVGGDLRGEEAFEIIEERAIAILDSEFQDFPEGVLQEFLMAYLYIRQIELGILPFPDPEEV